MNVFTLRQPELTKALPLLIASREQRGLNAEPGACERTLRDFLARGLGHFLVAEAEAEAIGYLALVWGYSVAQGRPVAEVQDLYVRPASRRSGAASALLADAESRARLYGAQRLQLRTDHADEPARQLYERAGYGCVEGRDVRIKRLG